MMEVKFTKHLLLWLRFPVTKLRWSLVLIIHCNILLFRSLALLQISRSFTRSITAPVLLMKKLETCSKKARESLVEKWPISLNSTSKISMLFSSQADLALLKISQTGLSKVKKILGAFKHWFKDLTAPWTQQSRQKSPRFILRRNHLHSAALLLISPRSSSQAAQLPLALQVR